MPNLYGLVFFLSAGEINILNVKLSSTTVSVLFAVLFLGSKQRPLLGKPQHDEEGWTKVVSEGPLGCQV